MSEFIVYGHFNSSPAARVVLFLSMAGLPFAYRHVDLRQQAQKTPDYLAINRFGRVPALVHGEVRLGESSVILTYLASVTGRFGGHDAMDALRLAEWLSWIGDGVLPVQRLRALKKFGGDPAAIPWVSQQAANGLTLLAGTFADGRPFVHGDRPTIADIYLFPWIDIAEEGGITIGDHPAIRAWYDRMLTLPGVKRQYELMPTADAG